MKKFPLVMTATINPRGMAGLSVNDLSERRRQYFQTFSFYLENPSLQAIVFIENSGADLEEFRQAAAAYPSRRVELISCSLNDYPRQLGKSYGEMLILDYVTEHSQLVKEAGGFIKVTGRFPILNIDALLKEAEKRQPWELFCDCKNHSVYDWLHLGWNGHACDTRFFMVTLSFYRQFFYGKYKDLDDSQGKLVEMLFFQVAMDQHRLIPMVRRFYTEPEYAGKAGHVQISIIGVNNYSGRIARTKRRIRQFGRKWFHWFWF